MTPDLQARIETLARECANLPLVNADYGRLDELELHILNRLTTLAEQIVSEKDAEAAALLEYAEAAIRTVEECPEEDCKHCRHIMPVYNRYGTLDKSTAGRDTLAELVQLRERVRELETGNNRMRSLLLSYRGWFLQSGQTEINQEAGIAQIDYALSYTTEPSR